MVDLAYKDGAKTVLDTYRGERVLFIADNNHYATTEIHGFAATVAAAGRDKGITSLGLEAIPVGHQFLLDGYMTGAISRTEYLALNNTLSHTHLQTNAQKEKFYGQIADLMDSGTRVVGLGSLAAVTSGIATEDFAQKAEEVGMRIQFDLVRLKLGQNGEIDKDPRQYVERYLTEQGARTDLSDDHKEVLKDAWIGLKDDPADPHNDSNREFYKDPENLKDLFDKTFYALHPLYKEYEKYNDMVVPSSGPFNDVRMGADPQTADRIIKELETTPGNMVVVYGALHTVHDKDIDGQLRKNGIPVMMVDANQALWVCPPGLSICEDIGTLFKYMEESATRNGDPNRYKMPDFIHQPGNIIKRDAPEPVDTAEPSLQNKPRPTLSFVPG